MDVQQGIGGENANSDPLENIFGMDGGTVTERVSAETKLPTDLTGKGVLIAIIDSGIDYLHPDFQIQTAPAASCIYGIRAGILYTRKRR